MPKKSISTKARRTPRLYTVRKSGIHGKGVFAATVIPKGARIIEYKGKRMTTEEADAHYGPYEKTEVVLLFSVDDSTVIDAAVGGNSARFINHSCAPNCEAVDENGRIFIESLRRIEPGEELAYDYNLQLDARERRKSAELYPCRCGSRRCRGTLAEPRRRKDS